ncbi:MAG: serine/threonine-protein phosphatase [Ectothiorhodospiraceae bacterium]|nr:serine/threonine-protein phosphatase [Ectothiorhodospiraceae bacterium]MCH8507064.1 serine/threonine-protein phosphatase [Ectothiorhodospiraceae bacterium]
MPEPGREAVLITRGSTHPGLVRQRNEDAFLELPESGLWAIADGMGGHLCGDHASSTLIQALHELGLRCAGEPLLDQLPAVVSRVNDRLLAEGAAWGHGQVVGSTLAALVLEADNYHCYWAGDSRIYLMRNRQLTRLTRDHTAWPNDVRTCELAGNPPLTRAVGAGPALELDSTHGHLYEGDAFLLCSDGLCGVVDDDSLARLLRGHSPYTVCQALMDAALAEGGPDNISCITVALCEDASN